MAAEDWVAARKEFLDNIPSGQVLRHAEIAKINNMTINRARRFLQELVMMGALEQTCEFQPGYVLKYKYKKPV